MGCVSLRRGTEAKPQLLKVEGFLNLHLRRNNAAVRPGVVLNVDDDSQQMHS
jgi:hypothetical protein